MSRRITEWTLAVVRQLADDDGLVTAGLGTIARTANRDLPSVRYTLRTLVRDGLIERVSVGGQGKGDRAVFKVLP